MTSIENSKAVCTLTEHGARRVSPDKAITTEIDELHQSNRAPSDSELLHCRDTVIEASKDAADISKEIAIAQAHLEHLVQELQDTERIAEVHQRILSSPRRLNHDVLMEIFLIACQPSMLEEDAHTLDPHQPAWRLAQVCQKWRACIAKDMPTLWTDIKILVDTKYAGRSFLLEHSLRRSNGYPLKVTLLFHANFRKNSAFNFLLHRLTMSCDRWRSLHFEGWFKSFEAWNKNIIRDNIPQLQKLSYQIHSDDSHTVPGLDTLFSPNLTDLHLTGRFVVSDLPRAQLKVLTWRRHNIHNVNLCLESPTALLTYPSLEIYDADCVYRHSPLTETSSPRSITLPKLHSLTLHSFIDDDSMQLSIDTRTSEVEKTLRCVTLPALTALVITGPMYHGRSLVDCIQRSKCQLGSLEVSLQDIRDLQPILALTPSLTRLSVEVASEISGIIVTFIGLLERAFKHCSELRDLQLIALNRSHSDETQEKSGLEDLVSFLTRQVKGKNGKKNVLPKNLSIRCSASVGLTLTSVLANRLVDVGRSSAGTRRLEAFELDIERILARMICVDRPLDA